MGACKNSVCSRPLSSQSYSFKYLHYYGCTTHTTETMFKRVLKRKIRQEREEELGIDSEMKEVLGMQDTDSDESDSSSDEGDSEAEAEEQGSDEESEVDDEAEDDEEDGSEEELDEAESVPEESDSDNEAQLPQMSVTDAVSEPIYLVSLDSEIKACILCPGKLLKNSTMADVHRSSKVCFTTWL